MAEYSDTLQLRKRKNREYKICLNNGALRLLDHDAPWLWQYYQIMIVVTF